MWRALSRRGGALALLALLLGLGQAAWPAAPVAADNTPPPTHVTIPGTIDSKIGCSGDWQPDCAKAYLTYDAGADVWTGGWPLPAGQYEYKVALNDSWGENYGLHTVRDGPNIPLNVTQAQTVRFYYDHKTHWVADSVTAAIATVVGTFQQKLGCKQDWQADCLRSWMEDPAGSGTYLWTTTGLPAGQYEAKVAINESMNETYGAKDGGNKAFSVPFDGAAMSFQYDPKSHELTVGRAQMGSLTTARAHWVTRDTLAWKVPGDAKNAYKLYYDPAGALKLDPTGVSGGQAIPLTYDPAGLPAAVLARFPQLKGFTALKVAAGDLSRVPDILKGQIALSAADSQGNLIDATTPQIPGVLDDLYHYDGPLGVSYSGDTPTLRVWAPTAQAVSLQLFADAASKSPQTVAMTDDTATGVWSAAGTPAWTGQYYLYDVQVYVPATGKVEHNVVTDPYSISLATASTLSQIVNLDDPALKPAGWGSLQKPPLASPTDIVLYELHLRDFSINDPTVPAAQRGTYLAFTDQGSNGMKHLAALAQAGLTHVHLLPVFDFASIHENASGRAEPDMSAFANVAGDSAEPQNIAGQYKDRDGFNWGYDPYHYMVPEGSYASDPEGSTRIREFRAMVEGLNAIGLRVTMDVVFNHTSQAGQDIQSVLDKIVPGYYYRLDPDGKIYTSTCCPDTASEHAMMQKLMIDSVLLWAKEYKVDSFRFDLMGHHMVANMTALQDALHGLTLAKDGVDGSKIYLYGEGWNFGEVADNALGVNATQINLAGTGVGTFNDRLRDGARGGSPFAPKLEQGFLTGLALNPNGTDQGTVLSQTAKLLLETDWIRLGLAGNLKDYPLVDSSGATVPGAQVSYNGAPAGYTLQPQEDINYVEAHDNETLWDASAYKLPINTTMADRVRTQNLGADLVLLAQGVPFVQAGQDLLRSKSLDGNSYNSGDWFNRIDWTMQTNNWGVGLPPEADNKSNWPLMTPLLANPALKPAPSDIQAAATHFQEMLRIRKSSKLFRLDTDADVQARLHFLNTGPRQIPGLIVMTLADQGGADLDPQADALVVLFNATGQTQSFRAAPLAGLPLALHPIQAASADPLVRTARFDSRSGTFTVPERTTAVFVLPQGSTARLPAALTVPGARELPKSGQPGGIPGWVWLALAGLGLLGGLTLRRRKMRA